VKFDLTLEDYSIILNALHYYKKVEKRGKFSDFDVDKVNKLRDKMAVQLIWDNTDIDKFIHKE